MLFHLSFLLLSYISFDRSIIRFSRLFKNARMQGLRSPEERRRTFERTSSDEGRGNAADGYFSTVGHQNKKAMGPFPWLYNLAEPWVIFLTHSPLCQ
jgi:hypothetical protein